MNDIIIGAMSDIEYERVQLWSQSIDKSGFNGLKAMIGFNISDRTKSLLEDNGFIVFLTSQDRNTEDTGYVFMEHFTYRTPAARHFYHWLFLKNLKQDIRYVISTDVTDVIFQSNPSVWLEQHLGRKKLVVGSEAISHRDEPWGNEVLLETFGAEIHEHLQSAPIYNAGAIAGEYEYFKDFSLNLSMIIFGLNHMLPDQAAMNVLLSTEPYKSITLFNDHDSTWACQVGTTAAPDKIAQFRPFLHSPEPVFDGRHAYNSQNKKYAIVHQYNRNPIWNAAMESLYG